MNDRLTRRRPSTFFLSLRTFSFTALIWLCKSDVELTVLENADDAQHDEIKKSWVLSLGFIPGVSRDAR